MEKFDEKDGVWRTIGGRRIFIRDGESISDAMKRSNRYPSAENKREKAEEVRETKTEDDNDYRMAHRPTETEITADNLINQDVESPMPKDAYEHPEYYSVIGKEYTKETMEQLNKVRNNPDGEVTIYRATTGDRINEGDWITLSKSYAEHHNESQLDGKGKVVEMKVKAKDIQFAGDDLAEWGYFPKERDYAQDKAEKVRKELAEKNKEPAPRLTATAEKYLKRSVEEKESYGINRQEEPKKEPKIVSSNEVLSTLKNATSWEDIHSAISAVEDSETQKHLRQEAKELQDADSDIKGSASYLRSEAMLYGVEDNVSSSDKVYRNAYEDYLKAHPASRLTFAEFKKYME